MTASLSAPTPLADHHDLETFASGVAMLDDWLRRRARANEIHGASRTYVVASGSVVVGYYCLAASSVTLTDAVPKLKRNMPDPVPMAVLGRLAVDERWRGKDIGSSMLQDAFLRLIQAAEIIGVRGVLVHAISDEAKTFYVRYGFRPTPSDPMTLMAPLPTRVP